MTLNIPPGFLNLVFTHQITGSSKPASCTIGVSHEPLGGAVTYQQILSDAAVGWTGDVMPIVSSTCQVIGAKAYDQNGIVAEIALSTSGGEAGGALPPNCAFLVKKVTGQAGRHNVGRMFIPGVREASIDAAGFLDSAYRTGIQTAMNNFLDHPNTVASLIGWVLLHHVEEGDDPNTNVPDLITALPVQTRIGQQQRRFK